MKKQLFFFVILVTGGLLSSCNDSDNEKTIETKEFEFRKDAEIMLVSADGDPIQELDIEIADDLYERETGLMHRESMEENQGMLFIYTNAAPRTFHMKNTLIPLDLIFFGSDSTAISFQENAVPMDETSLPSGGDAQFVLEINGGLVDEWGIELGDKFELVEE